MRIMIFNDYTSRSNIVNTIYWISIIASINLSNHNNIAKEIKVISTFASIVLDASTNMLATFFFESEQYINKVIKINIYSKSRK